MTGSASIATGSSSFFTSSTGSDAASRAASSAAMSDFFWSRGFLVAGGTFSASSGLAGAAGLALPPPKKEAMLR